VTPKPAQASRVTLAVLMQPTEANIHGNVHGGLVMKLMDDAGAAAAIRHAQRPVVTVAVDQVTFREPIHVGDLVTLDALLTYTGRTSMEVQINVTAQNLITDEHTHTNTAYFVYVALNAESRPAPVPPLQLDSDEDRARWQAAQERQAYRLSQRNR
jgi:acyl-CoA hydrolase